MSDWLFNEAYRSHFDLPPTQQREVVKRLAKKNILDVTAASDEIQTVLRAVWTAYGNKKERARAASAKSRATKKDDVSCSTGGDTLAQDAAACEVSCEPNATVECVAEAAQTAPEVVAAPTLAVAAKKKSVARADNVASESAPVAAVPTVASTQAPKRLAETTPRRGLCAMVASASI